MADFSGIADESTGDNIRNYILSQPKEIVDDKNAISVGNNYIYHSDYISPFTIEFDIVDDLSGLSDLLNPDSQLFQDYSDAFCTDVSHTAWLILVSLYPRFEKVGGILLYICTWLRLSFRPSFRNSVTLFRQRYLHNRLR